MYQTSRTINPIFFVKRQGLSNLSALVLLILFSFCFHNMCANLALLWFGKFCSHVLIHSFKVEVDILNQLILCTSGYKDMVLCRTLRHPYCMRRYFTPIARCLCVISNLSPGFSGFLYDVFCFAMRGPVRCNISNIYGGIRRKCHKTADHPALVPSWFGHKEQNCVVFKDKVKILVTIYFVFSFFSCRQLISYVCIF